MVDTQVCWRWGRRQGQRARSAGSPHASIFRNRHHHHQHPSHPPALQIFDIETGDHTTVFNANPQGWEETESGVQVDLNSWATIMGLDVIPAGEEGSSRDLLLVLWPWQHWRTRFWHTLYPPPPTCPPACSPAARPACLPACLPGSPTPAAGAIVAGDNFGRVHFLDPRMPHPIASLQLHKKKTGKVGRQAAGPSGLT